MDKFVTKREKNVSGVDEIFTPDELYEMLSECDFGVISAALTPETTGLIGEKELKAMKPTAYLINIARGKILNETALIRALKEGWIAGAGLDVFQAEPLPPESELWEVPNLILSSHMSGFTRISRDREIEFFCENMRRFLAGEQLLNVVHQ
ncbi:NAD(P)-dependent oxidoreductase [Chloroflexota bacterium]